MVVGRAVVECLLRVEGDYGEENGGEHLCAPARRVGEGGEEGRASILIFFSARLPFFFTGHASTLEAEQQRSFLKIADSHVRCSAE